MKGRRLEVLTNPETGRPDVNLNPPTQPGDYTGPITGYTSDKPAVMYLLPNQQPGDTPRHVTAPPHVFTEEDDGSLTITASIEHKGEGYWHGYLTKGIWSEA